VEIVKGLNGKGIPGPRKKGWSKTSLHAILNNEAYAGTLVWGRNSKRGLEPVVVRDACPALVTRTDFTRVQALMHERAFVASHPKRTASRFLLSSLARCGYCGKPWRFSSHMGRGVNKKPYRVVSIIVNQHVFDKMQIYRIFRTCEIGKSGRGTQSELIL
jgi:hypothetical protein